MVESLLLWFVLIFYQETDLFYQSDGRAKRNRAHNRLWRQETHLADRHSDRFCVRRDGGELPIIAKFYFKLGCRANFDFCTRRWLHRHFQLAVFAAFVDEKSRTRFQALRFDAIR